MTSSLSSILFEQVRNGEPPNWGAIQNLIDDSSNNFLITQSIGDEGEYLLHYACEYDAPYNFIQKLVRIYPEALKVRGGLCQWTPLICACSTANDESLLIIQFLFATYPEALQQYDNEYRYPLHWACSCQSVSVVQFLIDQYRDPLREKDSSGLTPIM